MKNDDSNVNTDLVDAAVSAGYRAFSLETTSAKLDRDILRAARREVSPGSNSAWNIGWLRPAAFAATLGLSIALLMEFREVQDLAAPSDMLLDSVTIASPIPDGVAPIIATDPPSEGEAPLAVINEDPRRSATGDNRDDVGIVQPAPLAKHEAAEMDSFREAAGITAQQLRDVDASADASLRQMPKTEVAPAAAVSRSVSSDTATRRSNCSAEQRANPDDWWQCVDVLQRAGLHDQAALERQDLLDKYPLYSPR